MRQRGKKSAAQLDISVTGAPHRLATPTGLSAAERAAFERLVNTVNPQHFRQCDIPLLVTMVQTEILTRKLGRDQRKLDAFNVASRLLMSLATKLRLTPQARYEPRGAARMQPPSGPVPWHRDKNAPWTRDDDEETKIQ